MILNLHVTGDCNLRCDYCYASPKTRESMTWETARAAIAMAATESPDLHVIFFGGEPLLRRDLVEQVVSARRDAVFGAVRIHLQLVTNGTLVDEEFARWSARHGISVCVSMDGTQHTHDLHRTNSAGQGTWDRVAEAVRTLVRLHPYLHVQMVISPDTAHLVDESIACIFGLGVRHVSTAIDYRATWDRSSLGSLARAYRRAADLYCDKTRRGERFFLSCFDARIRTHVHGPCAREERCTAGLHQISVAPSGKLYPCVQFVGGSDYVLGAVDTGFDAPARERFAAAAEAEKSECRGCKLHGRCMSWCACANWAGASSVKRVSPVLCEHERMLMPIADRVAARLFRRRDSLFLHKHYNAAYPIASVTEDLLHPREVES